MARKKPTTKASERESAREQMGIPERKITEAAMWYFDQILPLWEQELEQIEESLNRYDRLQGHVSSADMNYLRSALHFFAEVIKKAIGVKLFRFFLQAPSIDQFEMLDLELNPDAFTFCELAPNDPRHSKNINVLSVSNKEEVLTIFEPLIVEMEAFFQFLDYLKALQKKNEQRKARIDRLDGKVHEFSSEIERVLNALKYFERRTEEGTLNNDERREKRELEDRRDELRKRIDGNEGKVSHDKQALVAEEERFIKLMMRFFMQYQFKKDFSLQNLIASSDELMEHLKTAKRIKRADLRKEIGAILNTEKEIRIPDLQEDLKEFIYEQRAFVQFKKGVFRAALPSAFLFLVGVATGYYFVSQGGDFDQLIAFDTESQPDQKGGYEEAVLEANMPPQVPNASSFPNRDLEEPEDFTLFMKDLLRNPFIVERLTGDQMNKLSEFKDFKAIVRFLLTIGFIDSKAALTKSVRDLFSYEVMDIAFFGTRKGERWVVGQLKQEFLSYLDGFYDGFVTAELQLKTSEGKILKTSAGKFLADEKTFCEGTVIAKYEIHFVPNAMGFTSGGVTGKGEDLVPKEVWTWDVCDFD